MAIIHRRSAALAFATLGFMLALGAAATMQQKPFEPVEGQAGKDVVWVPTPAAIVEKMLDVAKVTPQDYVIDLGSGDGRNVIAAAKRGAQGLGVEYNPDMVELSKRNAAAAGVPDKAVFVQGDMYLADISKASVMALFLLPDNLTKLRDKLVSLRPGSRIVANTFGIEGWEPDYTEVVPDCSAWCTVMLWIVPANVSGAWQTPQGALSISQSFQVVSGTLGAAPIAEAKVRGDEITFTAGGAQYTGRMSGDAITGTATVSGKQAPWRATRTAVGPRE
jgi:SAM-dependent methyltransferase